VEKPRAGSRTDSEERQIAEAVRESGKAQAEWIRGALLSAAGGACGDRRAWRLGSLLFSR